MTERSSAYGSFRSRVNFYFRFLHLATLRTMPLVALFNKKLWGIVTCTKCWQWISLLEFCELWYTKNFKPCELKLLNKKDPKYFPKCYQTQNPHGEIKPDPSLEVEKSSAEKILHWKIPPLKNSSTEEFLRWNIQMFWYDSTKYLHL